MARISLSRRLAFGNKTGLLQVVRTNSQAFAGSSNTLVVVTWPVAFADTNYTVFAMIVDEDASDFSLGASFGGTVYNKLAASVTIVVNNGVAGAHNGHVEAFAIHD